MDNFEKLLEINRSAVERFVRFRLNSKADADDVLQEIYLTAYQKFWQLKNKDSFKAWIISIARNKCNDYCRDKACRLEVSIDEIKKRSWLTANMVLNNLCAVVRLHNRLYSVISYVNSFL